MKILKHQNIESSVITITSVANELFDLVDVAGSVTNSQAHFMSPTEGGLDNSANGILITPKDGDIHLAFNDLLPTATLGMPLAQGVKYQIPNFKTEEASLINVSGSDVLASIEFLYTYPTDTFTATVEGSQANPITVSTAPFRVATLPHSNVTASSSTITVFAANASRNFASFFNDSTNACFLKFAPGASSTSFFTILRPGEITIMETIVVEDELTAQWATTFSQNGALRVTQA